MSLHNIPATTMMMMMNDKNAFMNLNKFYIMEKTTPSAGTLSEKAKAKEDIKQEKFSFNNSSSLSIVDRHQQTINYRDDSSNKNNNYYGKGKDSSLSEEEGTSNNTKVYYYYYYSWKRLKNIESSIAKLRKTQNIAGDSRYILPQNDDNDILPYGHVMSELSKRILSRHVAQSNVLIFKVNSNRKNNNNVSYNLWKDAKEEGHTIHIINDDDAGDQQRRRRRERRHGSLTTIDAWWEKKKKKIGALKNNTATTTSSSLPNFLLLLLDSHPIGNGDDDRSSLYFSSYSAGSNFLKHGPTITYTVLGITIAIIRNSQGDKVLKVSSTEIDTINLLLEHNYKVQLLSSSDFWSYDNNNSDEDYLTITQHYNDYRDITTILFEPNDLITKDNLETFLQWGANAAYISKALFLASNYDNNDKSYNKSTQDDNKNNSKQQPNTDITTAIFKAYLFATRGLDLAIPSRRQYLVGSSYSNINGTLRGIIEPKNGLQKERRKMVQNVQFKDCPAHYRLNVKFINTTTNTPNVSSSSSSLSLLDKQKSEKRRIQILQETNNKVVVDDDDDSWWNSIQIICDRHDVTLEAYKLFKNDNDNLQLWINIENENNYKRTQSKQVESVCIRSNCNAFLKNSTSALPPKFEVSCATRIVVPDKHVLRPKEEAATSMTNNSEAEDKNLRKNKSNDNEKKVKADDNQVLSPPLNILVIMINPISRSQFDFIMPRTKILLEEEELNFTQFTKYTTVDNNSEPNQQAALYAGIKLQSRDGINNNNNNNNSNKDTSNTTWIWDDLQNLKGYVTFKAEDGCIIPNNLNMVQNMIQQPNTTHGQALHQLYCFDFERPNCLGGKLAAEYLFEHAKEFIGAYNNNDERHHHSPPWAAFLSLIDTHEDTMTLGAIIDKILATFLKDTIFENKNISDNTMIVLLSDHGLHYGQYFQSSIEGERERSQPILYIRIPNNKNDSKNMSNNSSLQAESMAKYNANKWTTPFDVHKTLLEVAGIKNDDNNYGSSLLRELPSTRNTCRGAGLIPEKHCQLLEPKTGTTIEEGKEEKEQGRKRKQQIILPPSISSFYADIPRDHRLKEESCQEPTYNTTELFELVRTKLRVKKATQLNMPCKCSTSHRDWFRCPSNPWADNIKNDRDYEEYFLLVSCKGFPLHLDIRIIPQKQYIARYDEKKVEQRKVTTESTTTATTNSVRTNTADSPPPNILFLELDSVSIPYANRHLKQTRRFLKQFHITTNQEETKCKNGLCGFDFKRFAIAGPNSIANQVASLSGCITTHEHLTCKPTIDDTLNTGEICRDPKYFEYDMKLINKGPQSHTIYCPRKVSKPFLYDFASQEAGYTTFFGEEFCYTGSPWVMQENVFKLNADFYLHKIFCRIASKLAKKIVHDWYMVQFYSCINKGNDGITKHMIGLKFLRAIWDAYPSTPKFAYLNSLAAHTYTEDTARQALEVEEFDVSLSTFLKRMLLERKDTDNTIIIIRSDHGLQGGSTNTVDYNTQLEQRHPWTEIIIPEKYLENKQHLIINSQERMVTPYDLNFMLRNFMMSGKGDNTPRQNWVYDIVHETIPKDRTCFDAKIPKDFCSQEYTPFPMFGTCNMFEEQQAAYCSDPFLSNYN